MQAAMDLVLPYIHERWQFDRPIGTFELMQGKACGYVYFTAICQSFFVIALQKIALITRFHAEIPLPAYYSHQKMQ